jgi:hypothetical protein
MKVLLRNIFHWAIMVGNTIIPLRLRLSIVLALKVVSNDTEGGRLVVSIDGPLICQHFRRF